MTDPKPDQIPTPAPDDVPAEQPTDIDEPGEDDPAVDHEPTAPGE